jgi:hypothetical protein
MCCSLEHGRALKRCLNKPGFDIRGADVGEQISMVPVRESNASDRRIRP